MNFVMPSPSSIYENAKDITTVTIESNVFKNTILVGLVLHRREQIMHCICNEINQ
jgi:hypothetical protein